MIIFMSFVFSGCTFSYDEMPDNAIDQMMMEGIVQVGKYDLKRLDYQKVNCLKIKQLKDSGDEGWVWKEKIVTKEEDIKKVIEYLKSLSYTDMDQEKVFGFGQIVELKERNNLVFVLSGDTVNINGKYFGILIKEYENLRKLYEDFNYKEEASERYE